MSHKQLMVRRPHETQYDLQPLTRVTLNCKPKDFSSPFQLDRHMQVMHWWAVDHTQDQGCQWQATRWHDRCMKERSKVGRQINHFSVRRWESLLWLTVGETVILSSTRHEYRGTCWWSTIRSPYRSLVALWNTAANSLFCTLDRVSINQSEARVDPLQGIANKGNNDRFLGGYFGEKTLEPCTWWFSNQSSYPC